MRNKRKKERKKENDDIIQAHASTEKKQQFSHLCCTAIISVRGMEKGEKINLADGIIKKKVRKELSINWAYSVRKVRTMCFTMSTALTRTVSARLFVCLFIYLY